MMGHNRQSWHRGDVGPVSPVTLRIRRYVLAVIHNYQSGDRLSEFVPTLLERNPEIQVVYTLAPGSRFEAGGAEYIRALDAAILPWDEAVRYEYALALAANHGHLEQVRAPVLVLSHGVGHSRVVARGNGYGPPVARPVGGAVHGALVRYGRVVPAAIGVAHESQRDELAAVVPETAQVTHVVGDPCHDRAMAGLSDRERFRRAVGVGREERLVVLSSSWGSTGALGVHPGILDRLVSELPRGYVAAAILHPGVWWAHSPRQIRAWLSGARSRGLRLLAPTSPWLGLLVAADVIVGDPGSLTSYGAGLGRPVILAGRGLFDVAPGSQTETLHDLAPHYRSDASFGPQIEEAIDGHRPGTTDVLRSRLTSVPGRFAPLMRALLYSMMDLEEPDGAAGLAPLRAPRFIGVGEEEEGAA